LTSRSKSKYFLVVALTAGADSAQCARGFESRKSIESNSSTRKGALRGSFLYFRMQLQNLRLSHSRRKSNFAHRYWQFPAAISTAKRILASCNLGGSAHA